VPRLRLHDVWVAARGLGSWANDPYDCASSTRRTASRAASAVRATAVRT
jgi:hypothetical protein